MSFFLGKVIVVLRHPAARNVGGETPPTKGVKASKYTFVVYFIFTFNNGLIRLWTKCSATTGIPIGACFFVFLVRIDASPVICGRPVGHPCTTSPSLGQTGICAMRPPRPAYGIYALCSLHFAASFMQPFFKTTIIFTFAS